MPALAPRIRNPVAGNLRPPARNIPLLGHSAVPNCPPSQRLHDTRQDRPCADSQLSVRTSYHSVSGGPPRLHSPIPLLAGPAIQRVSETVFGSGQGSTRKLNLESLPALLRTGL